MQEITSPMRQPVRMEGIAAGSTILNRIWLLGVPAASADQISFCSTMLAPYQVESRIGNSASAATSVIFEAWSKASSNNSAGYSATFGTGASTRTTGFTTALTVGLTAAARPRPTPSTTAMEKPANSRNSVTTISCKNPAETSCCDSRANTRPGGGSSDTGA